MSYVSLVLNTIPPIAALLAVYYSYKAIKVNKELFYKTLESEEQRLLPLFDIYRNHIFLDEKGLPSNTNYDPEALFSLHFLNINNNAIANIMAVDFIEDNDVEPIVSGEYIRAINYTTNGVLLSINKKNIDEKDYGISIKYKALNGITFITKIVFYISSGLFVVIKEQTTVKI